MTQLTFDFSTRSGFSANTPGVALLIREKSTEQAPGYLSVPASRPASTAPMPANASNAWPAIQTGQSLALHDAGRKELHHIGDLAQAVIDRYEIVHRRRAARLAREQAARQQATTRKVACK